MPASEIFISGHLLLDTKNGEIYPEIPSRKRIFISKKANGVTSLSMIVNDPKYIINLSLEDSERLKIGSIVKLSCAYIIR